MPFESKSETKKNIGRGKIRISASKEKGVLGLTNQDKLNLAKSGVKDLIAGTIEGNRAKKKRGSTRYLAWNE